MPHLRGSAGVLRAAWIVWIAVVIIASLLPSDSTPIEALSLLGISDKLEHFGAYAVLAFLPTLRERRAFMAWAAIAVVLLGVGLEFGQLESPGRSFEIGDMEADFLGVCAGVLAALPFRTRLQKTAPSPEKHPVNVG
jgi:VanZ family protein